jgi:hypothetical protein
MAEDKFIFLPSWCLVRDLNYGPFPVTKHNNETELGGGGYLDAEEKNQVDVT